MLLGAALVLVGSAVLYYAVTGNDPRALISPTGALQAPPSPAAPSPGGRGSGGGSGAVATGGTPGVLAAIAVIRTFVATRYPRSRLVIGSVYRPGAIVAGTQSASEHAFGNAVDLRIEKASGGLDRVAMASLYNFLLATAPCELCYNHQGGCTTSHTDHLHYAPRPCHAS